MYYNAIHVQNRDDNKCVVLGSEFSQGPGDPPQVLVELWTRLCNDPDIGKQFVTVQRVLDNRIVETMNLRHPDEAAAEESRLRSGEAERAEAERKTAVLEIRRRMDASGLTVKDLTQELPAVPAPGQLEERAAAPPGVEPDSPDFPRTSRLSKKSASSP